MLACHVACHVYFNDLDLFIACHVACHVYSNDLDPFTACHVACHVSANDLDPFTGGGLYKVPFVECFLLKKQNRLVSLLEDITISKEEKNLLDALEAAPVA